MEFIPNSIRPTDSLVHSQRLVSLEEKARQQGETLIWIRRANIEIDSLNIFIREGYERLKVANQNDDTTTAAHILNLSSQLIKARDYLALRIKAMSLLDQQTQPAGFGQNEARQSSYAKPSEPYPEKLTIQPKSSGSRPWGRWLKSILAIAVVGFVLYSCLSPKTNSSTTNQVAIPTKAFSPAVIGTSIPTCTNEDTKYLDEQHRLIAEINRVSPQIDEELTRAINNLYLAKSASWRKSTFDLINQFGVLVDELGSLTPSPIFVNGHNAQLDDLYKSYQSDKASYIALTAPSEARINEAIAALTDADFSFQRANNIINKESCMRITHK